VFTDLGGDPLLTVLGVLSKNEYYYYTTTTTTTNIITSYQKTL
jgi:hypothetical protein